MLEATAPDGTIVGIDRDAATIDWAAARHARFGARFRAIHGDHRNLRTLLQEAGFFAVDGILADLGISSFQLDDPARGFSFLNDGPLDMRMDPRSGGPTAADLLRTASETELRRILRVYGEERLASPIARAIVRRRESGGVHTTHELADLVERVAGPAARRFRIHPATRTFQALRIAVNDEIEGLESFVSDAVSVLRLRERLVRTGCGRFLQQLIAHGDVSIPHLAQVDLVVEMRNLHKLCERVLLRRRKNGLVKRDLDRREARHFCAQAVG